MKRLTRGVFAALLALAFLARGTAAVCPPKSTEHGCCGKPAPSAPRTPCAEMACCQVLPSEAYPALSPVRDLVAFLPAPPILAAPIEPSFAVSACTDSSPPGPLVQSSSSRAPPALLG